MYLVACVITNRGIFHISNWCVPKGPQFKLYQLANLSHARAYLFIFVFISRFILSCHLGFPSPMICNIPDDKVHGANMGPTWALVGPHVGPINLAIRGVFWERGRFWSPELKAALNPNEWMNASKTTPTVSHTHPVTVIQCEWVILLTSGPCFYIKTTPSAVIIPIKEIQW